MNWDAVSSPHPRAAAEKARALAERERADAGVALARFEAMHRTRDVHRRRLALQPLGLDPRSAAPAGWAADRSHMLVSAGDTAQPLTPSQAARERTRLLWMAIGKIFAGLAVAAIGLAIGIAILGSMAG